MKKSTGMRVLRILLPAASLRSLTSDVDMFVAVDELGFTNSDDGSVLSTIALQ